LKYYSTNRKAETVSFREATIKGQAPDKGLYFPQEIPVVENVLIKEIEKLPDHEIAFRVIKPYIGKEIPEDILYSIVKETINFRIPLIGITDTIFSLELFHGPTLAFKDVGARFMSRCLAQFVKDRNEKVTILVATSGDTGGAVANGFYNVDGVEVVILYPSGKVSPVQEKQLTTLGNNIHALEVLGTFDDCQAMAKAAFADNELASNRFLTSANSINVARWLPQQFYYFFAYKQWKEKDNPPVISVPSGNFGNICSGILAMQSGLPVKHFIAACNCNDIVSNYLQTGKWETKIATPTISNAMDVGDPSNFVRIQEIYGHVFSRLKSRISADTITDEETMIIIKNVFEKYQYLLDPHGAVGYLALEKYLAKNPGCRGIFLETAHPVKFSEAVAKATASKVAVPPALQPIMHKPKNSTVIRPFYTELKDFLLK
jgi:threonine synthase